jgi:Homoserine dehydrogenase
MSADGQHFLLPQVEGIFSGTLSYIFNSFVAGGPSFSDIVSEAKAAGWAPSNSTLTHQQSLLAMPLDTAHCNFHMAPVKYSSGPAFDNQLWLMQHKCMRLTFLSNPEH